MAMDFSMYRFYKGEAENPFYKILEEAEIDKSHLPPSECMKYEYRLKANEMQELGDKGKFWFYESIFESNFWPKESSEWYAFLNSYGLGERFMKLLTEQDYERPTDEIKKQVFELWLEYFFSEKLYPEYGGENEHKKAYYSLNA